METVLIIILAVVAGLLAVSQLSSTKPTTKADAPPMFHILPYLAFLRVHDNEWVLLYRKGKFKRALATGTHFLMASGTSIVRLDKRMHECILNDQDVLTKDHLPFRISLAVEYVVRDPVRLISTLAITDLEQIDDRIYTATETSIRRVLNDLRMEDAARDRENLADQLTRALREDVDGWGIAIERIGIRDLLIDESVRASIASTALADREKAAAHKESEIEAKLARYGGKDEEMAARETAITAKEEELIHREAKLASKERDIDGREKMLADNEADLGVREKAFVNKNAGLAGKEKELVDGNAERAAKEKDLIDREVQIIGKERELKEKDAELTRREADLAAQEAALIAKSSQTKPAPKRKTAARKTAAKSKPKTAAKKKTAKPKTAAKTATKSADESKGNGKSPAQKTPKPDETATPPGGAATSAGAAQSDPVKSNGAQAPGTAQSDAASGPTPASTSDTPGGATEN